ncbi:unnamed protein product [Phytophthora fragariaefolia]|uniref:Unnamed protein product n=1 Tax=Phytophthora fragariaefolia TaxID=1490495 RepID=A0A9W7D3A1_9STRA|nr:unnamed protein product [Phytophthora fragariaefolia]
MDEVHELDGKLQAAAADLGASPRSAALSPDRTGIKGPASFGEGEEGEYEVKEVEQSRAAEFHASSSSEDEEESGGDHARDFHERTKFQLQMERSALGRPKTAAKDLEKYRDAVPNDFFQQFEGAATVDDAGSPPSVLAHARSTRSDNNSKSSARSRSARREASNEHISLGKLGILDMALIDMRVLDSLQMHTRRKTSKSTQDWSRSYQNLHQQWAYRLTESWYIPRPDGKDDKLGVDVLREPSGQTNVAELELLMQVSMTNQHRFRSKSEVVRSIEWAAQRPQEVDQWIASVEKVQRAKPLADVKYKHAMPPLSQLMELWPEVFESFLTTGGSTLPTLSEMDVNLKELVRIVCAVLDIPVYEGNYVQSLHVLFSLYLEMEAYERDAQRQQGLQR